MSRADLLLRQVLRFTPAAVVPAIAGLASISVFTRLLAPEEFGRYAVAMATVLILSALLFQWLIQGSDRYLPAATGGEAWPQLRAAVGRGALVVATGWLVFAAVLMFGTSAGLPPGLLTLALPCAGLIAVLGIFQSILAMLKAEQRSRSYSLLQAAESVLRLAVGTAFVLALVPSAASVLWGWLFGLAIVVAAGWQLAYPRSGVGRTVRLSDVLRRFARYGLPMTGWFACSLLLSVGDRYVIQWFRGSAELGIYSAAYGLVFGAVATLAAPVFLAAHPHLMRRWAEDRAGTAAELSVLAERLFIAGVIGTAIAVVFARDAARLLLAEKYVEGWRAMAPIAAGVALWHIGLCAHKPLEFTEQTVRLVAIAAGAAALNFALNVVLVPAYGYAAAAYTTLVSYAAYTAAALFAGRESLIWRVRVRPVATAAACTLVGMAAVLILRPHVDQVVGAGTGLMVAVALFAGAVALGLGAARDAVTAASR